ncbi:MAG: hypothetical protein WBV35_21695, partial [Steroidobacteraceae bacterium]
MNADSALAATALGLQVGGTVRASDVDAVRARASRGGLFRAHDAGDHAAILVNANLGYTPRLDQPLRCPAEPL